MGGGWLLSGVKTTVPAAPLAALMLVPAATPDGVAVFLVAPGDERVTVARQQVTGGDGAGRVVLAGVRLAGDRVLGSAASGRDAADWLVSHGTAGLCALHALTNEARRGRWFLQLRNPSLRVRQLARLAGMQDLAPAA